MLQLVFQPLQELSELYGQVQAASAAMTKISTVLDAEQDITDREGAPEIGRIAGHLQLDNVVFAYGDEPVIHGISIDVPEGGCVALVGESGGGKSTTAKLIARFYDPLEGAVRVDGVDLRDVQLRSVRRQLGVVLQDPFLFSGTIADNIRFGRPEATDDEVAAAAARDRRRPGRSAIRRRARPRRPRGRRGPLCRRAAADLDRAGAARRPAHPDPRRGDVEHRPAERDPDRAGIRHAAARPHVGDHRAPARDRPARRRDPRDREGPHRPARHRGGAAGRGRARSGGSPRRCTACRSATSRERDARSAPSTFSHSTQASSRMIGVALPSRSSPSTSTSGPPIMKSVCTRETLTPIASSSSGVEAVGAVDRHRQARAVGDVAGRVLVEQRVLEDEPRLLDGRGAVDERDLAEVRRLRIGLELAADDVGALRRTDVDDLPSLEAQLEIADDRARRRRADRSSGPCPRCGASRGR